MRAFFGPSSPLLLALGLLVAIYPLLSIIECRVNSDGQSGPNSESLNAIASIPNHDNRSPFLHGRQDIPSLGTSHRKGYVKKNLTIGYLTAITGADKNKAGRANSGALTLALDEINRSDKILPNVHLNVRWNDTKGDTVVATRVMTDMVCDGVAAFFGPEGACHVEAIVAQSRNIPMMAYRCSDYKASEVPTFARTEPPDTQVTKSLISFLKYYGWKKFSILYEETWTTVALSLKNQAKLMNYTINHFRNVIDMHQCCVNTLPCCSVGYWYRVINETREGTRIYVFLGSSYALREMMETMETAQLFETGEYIVISVDMMTYTPTLALNYLWKTQSLVTKITCAQDSFLKRAKSLFVVVVSPSFDNLDNNKKKFNEFNRLVKEYGAASPFFFSVPSVIKNLNYSTFSTIYAAYLYDAVYLYANALNDLIKNETNHDVIDEIASNGTRIISRIIEYQKYKSISGATIKIDRNGDSEGNFSVIAFQPYKREENDGMAGPDLFECPYYMSIVGYFLQTNFTKEHSNLDFQKDHSKMILWPNEQAGPPVDEPNCGFDNEKCEQTLVHSVVACAILAIILFCTMVIMASIYRKWKIELEIEGLLWKIEPNEIHGFFGNDMVSSPSKLSLISAVSMGSRCTNQVFTATAKFRGLVVRIKELKFSRKKDISRDIMKEMRLLRDLRHDNINSFIGACIEPMKVLLVTDYCAKGSLYDIIENEDIKLDDMFIASLVHDLIKGMLYLHNSPLVCHGNLKSSNCAVTSRWVLQVTDFGLHEIRHCAESDSIGEHQYYRNLFWKAPELLRTHQVPDKGTQKGDVYSFAIILYEIIGRRGPFGSTQYEPKQIIEKVKHQALQGGDPFRPDLSLLADTAMECADYIKSTMQDSWSEIPEQRPDFSVIRNRLKKMYGNRSRNIMDQMMAIMEKYANNLEDLVNERTRLLCEEKRKTEDLLHRMLPEPVAERLTKGHGVEPVSFDSVTIYFSDIVGFTSMSAESTPLQVVNFLNDLYTVFDRIIKGYDVYKVETIGDAYMVVSGLPIENDDRHVGEIASMALDLLAAVRTHQIQHRPNETLKLRIGIHTGPVVAGVVGLTMPRYCLFGDTVNTASRLESNGEPLKIHISPQCKDALDKLGGYTTEERGYVNMKGKGFVLTHWLTGATEKAIQKRDVDLNELPPLFCRPRRSPKLNSDSRQPSLIAFPYGPGAGSRRQSGVLRGASTDRDSTTSLHGSGISGAINKPLTRAPLYLLGNDSSKTTLNTIDANSDQTMDRLLEQRALKSRKFHNSQAATSVTLRQSKYPCIRESKSLDLFPNIKNKKSESPRLFTKLPKKSSRSLENCETNISTINLRANNKHLNNNNCANGNAVLISEDNVNGEDVDLPLLRKNSLTDGAILPDVANVPGQRRRQNRNDDNDITFTTKRWKSLETVSGPNSNDDNGSKKLLARASFKSWFLGLFNGSGLRTSDASLRKGVLTGYNDLQSEKESIV